MKSYSSFLEAVDASGFSVTDALKALDVPRSTYYRWQAKFRKHGKLGLRDKSSTPHHQWNELLVEEREVIDKIAFENPEWSSREISHFITDKKGFSVSEITVFRHLKKRGLIRSREEHMQITT